MADVMQHLRNTREGQATIKKKIFPSNTFKPGNILLHNAEEAECALDFKNQETKFMEEKSVVSNHTASGSDRPEANTAAGAVVWESISTDLSLCFFLCITALTMPRVILGYLNILHDL